MMELVQNVTHVASGKRQEPGSWCDGLAWPSQRTPLELLESSDGLELA